MGKIKGITVTLYETASTSKDPFGAPILIETPVQVDNVLIGEPSTDDVASSTQLYGRVIQYMLGIPKGDAHDWVNKKVEWSDSYGTHTVKTFGFPITGIEEMVPGDWHMKVRCEQYGG